MPVKGNKTAIQKLLQSGIGYGYHMIHNTSGNTIDAYEIDKKYMDDASKIIKDIGFVLSFLNLIKCARISEIQVFLKYFFLKYLFFTNKSCNFKKILILKGVLLRPLI